MHDSVFWWYQYPSFFWFTVPNCIGMNFCLGKGVESRTHQVMGQTYQFKDSFQWCGLHYEISVRIKRKRSIASSKLVPCLTSLLVAFFGIWFDLILIRVRLYRKSEFDLGCSIAQDLVQWVSTMVLYAVGSYVFHFFDVCPTCMGRKWNWQWET